MIHHPLFVTPYIVKSPDHNALINSNYAHIKAMAEECRAKGDWIGFVGCHAGPYQVEALNGIVKDLGDEDYWGTLGEILTGIDNAHQHQRTLRKLLKSERPGREHIMYDEERAAFAELPDVLTIYRGYGVAKCKMGWSWTTDPEKARWFAQRFAALDGVKPKVVQGACQKDDVIAHFTRRNESEVVIDPKDVQDIKAA